MEQRSIALDGPGGAGKTTLAKKAARQFRLIYVDTGALYRCVALYAFRNGVGAKAASDVVRLLPEINIEMKYDEQGVQRMLLNGEDVTDSIRTPEITMGASDVSAIPEVRFFLLQMQREMAEKYDVIMDGRDIGTVILPNAGLKVFVTAEPEVRANRRYIELKSKNIDVTYEDVLSELNLRDKNDSERETAPLKPAENALLLDTTHLDFEESFKALSDIIKNGGIA